MIKFHSAPSGDKTEEILPESQIQLTSQHILDLVAEVFFTGCGKMVIHVTNLPSAFSDLNTKIAGEVLQKFSNFRMQPAITGDFIQ